MVLWLPTVVLGLALVLQMVVLVERVFITVALAVTVMLPMVWAAVAVAQQATPVMAA
jgi:hypothetical protein